MKKQYTAPSLTVVTVSVERGYANSVPIDPASPARLSSSESKETEGFTNRSTGDGRSDWGSLSDNSFFSE